MNQSEAVYHKERNEDISRIYSLMALRLKVEDSILAIKMVFCNLCWGKFLLKTENVCLHRTAMLQTMWDDQAYTRLSLVWEKRNKISSSSPFTLKDVGCVVLRLSIFWPDTSNSGTVYILDRVHLPICNPYSFGQTTVHFLEHYLEIKQGLGQIWFEHYIFTPPNRI